MNKILIISFLYCFLSHNCPFCFGQQIETNDKYGYVGIRPLPRTQKEAESDWVPGISKIGTYDEQLKPNSFAAKNTDVVYEYQGNFLTKKCFFEHYLPFDRDWIDTNPYTNPLVQEIKRCEDNGWEVEHIIICREAYHVGRGKQGPYKEDPRILYPRDVKDYREVIKEANKKGIIKRKYYKLIQLVHNTTTFMDIPEAAETILSMDGVCYECHQFGVQWPFSISRAKEIARAANWVLDKGLEYIFYYGPFVYKEYESYYPFVERDWLYKFWEAGVPKHHPRMHYYLNCFPHAHGANRKVGPESDANSYLGFLVWLIKEIKGEYIK